MNARSALSAAAFAVTAIVLCAPAARAVSGGPVLLAQAAPAAPAAVPAEFAAGEVRRVDREGRKLTLRHGEIRNLEMPPMTMVFQVEDAAVLDTLKAGDKVRFKAVERGGNYVVVAIEPAR